AGDRAGCAMRAAGDGPRLPAQIERPDRGDLGGGEISQERVLLQDGLARPSTGPIKLEDPSLAALQLDLVDPGCQPAERQAEASRAHARRLGGVEDSIGCQLKEEAMHVSASMATGD